MTKDDILELALEAEFDYLRFAELLEAKVRADEREACAYIVEDWDSDLACPREIVDAIRARGEK